jgi:hypothetical protein
MGEDPETHLLSCSTTVHGAAAFISVRMAFGCLSRAVNGRTGGSYRRPGTDLTATLIAP